LSNFFQSLNFFNQENRGDEASLSNQAKFGCALGHCSAPTLGTNSISEPSLDLPGIFFPASAPIFLAARRVAHIEFDYVRTMFGSLNVTDYQVGSFD
jgi:hypothetical protein